MSRVFFAVLGNVWETGGPGFRQTPGGSLAVERADTYTRQVQGVGAAVEKMQQDGVMGRSDT